MTSPKLFLLSRKTLENNLEKLQAELRGVDIQMTVAVAPEDAEAAKQLTPDAVGQFQQVTAVVADFEADMVINEDGSVEFLSMTVFRDKEVPVSRIL